MKTTTRWFTMFICMLLSLSFMTGSAYAARLPNGTLAGKVTVFGSATPIPGATITATSPLGTKFTATSGAAGEYSISLPPATYQVICVATGYNTGSASAVIKSSLKKVLNFALKPATTTTISALGVTPAAFTEADDTIIQLRASVSGSIASATWSQVKGPKIPLTTFSASRASADARNLNVAVDAELVFRLTLVDTAQKTTYKDVSVFVAPKDITPILGPNIQVGGSTTAVQKFIYNGTDWSIFNLGSRLCTTPIGTTKGTVHSIYVPGFIQDIDLVTFNEKNYALLSIGDAGIVVVDISNPAAMFQVSNVKVNYYKDDITFAEGSGNVLTGNIKSSVKAPIAGLETDGTSLYIADSAYGIHKTALANLLGPAGPVLEADGTLLIDTEKYTLQFTGENPWGGPTNLKLYGGRLFAALSELGMGIFDPVTLEQVGRYNLYTDTSVVEDWFVGMDVRTAVQKDPVTAEPFVDAFTGMPDYRQTSFELIEVKHNGVVAPIPWASFDRYGKWYYKARGFDFAQFEGRTIAYIAYSLGGLIAVDISGYQTATPANFLNARYIGYVPAVPANGPDKATGSDTATDTHSILSYHGAGMLKESGVIDVKVRDNIAYLTDHFGGLVLVDNIATPETHWKGPNAPYNNDTDGLLGNHIPDTEFITSYDMAPHDPLDNESMPEWMFHAPCLLTSCEIGGHSNRIVLMDSLGLASAGNVDLLVSVGAGGLDYLDIKDLSAPLMEDRFGIPVFFPTTSEIGAKLDGTPGQTITIGHASGIASSDRYIYNADGPHGLSAWKIVDDNGYPTDSIHLVANTLQDEYPEILGDVTVYPAAHAKNVIVDQSHQVAWVPTNSLGVRRVDISRVEAGQGAVGTPLLLPLKLTDLFEHNSAAGLEEATVEGLQYQDHAYDVEIRGEYAFTADGNNGITVYDTTKDPSIMNSGFVVSNYGGVGEGKAPLGKALGITLWTNPADGKSYAFVAAGPRGVGVVDITDVKNMKPVKVFEPIKMEDGKVGKADGKSVDVKVVGDYAYFTYDSFGVVCYRLSDLIAPLPEGVDPTDIWTKDEETETVLYDYRPKAVSRFKLQQVPGYETVSGGAVRFTHTQLNGKLVFYVAFAEAGLLKIDWTDPAKPTLVELVPTMGECSDVTISNGRLYVADGGAGMLFFK